MSQTGNFTAPQTATATNWKLGDWRIDADTSQLYAVIIYLDASGNPVKNVALAPIAVPNTPMQNMANAIVTKAIVQGALPAGSTIVIS